MKRAFVTTRYRVPLPGLAAPVRLAVVADLHNEAVPGLLREVLSSGADALLLPGDFADRDTGAANGLAFIAEAARRLPTLLSLGNHETRLDLMAITAACEEVGAVLLDDRSVTLRGLTVGGLTTGYRPGLRQSRLRATPPPDLAFLDAFAATPGPRLLLCHHPEYYRPYIRLRDIPLTVAGHAHGGQWRVLGQGIFAPGQGIFPRYTAGLHEGRMVVSRGFANNRRLIPRIGNPRELVLLDILPAGDPCVAK